MLKTSLVRNPLIDLIYTDNASHLNIEERVGNHINWFNPTTILCLSRARVWISSIICCGLFLCTV